MKRKEFLAKTVILGLGACCGVSLLSSCTNAIMIQAEIDDTNKIQIDKSSFKEKKYVVVQNSQLVGPIYLVKQEDTYMALSMICTHKQCEVVPAGDVLVCPCHGAEYNNKGKVLSGPTSINLPQYKVSIKSDKVYIHLNS